MPYNACCITPFRRQLRSSLSREKQFAVAKPLKKGDRGRTTTAGNLANIGLSHDNLDENGAAVRV